MIILQIEHSVPDFQAWKKAFDSDPAKRKESGVRSYRIFKAIDNPSYVIIELAFNDVKTADSFHQVLKKVWNNVEGRVMMNPQSRIVEEVETIEL
jgi:hypothetical protein